MLDPFVQPVQHYGATHAHYAKPPKSYELYLSYSALRVPTLLGVVV